MAYDARLCTAGIVVLQADVDKLLHDNVAASERDWLLQRVGGLAGALGWLCRRHALVNGLEAGAGQAGIGNLRAAIASEQWNQAALALRDLRARMPLQLEGLLPGNATAQAREEGAAIYRHYCRGCHLRSLPKQTPPVYSLRGMAHQQPAPEFIARMLIGIHGTPEIGLRNPLSPQDIAGIYAFLLGASKD